jgi:hypothetical protein
MIEQHDIGTATALRFSGDIDWAAYERDRESLLEENRGWFVAYNGGIRIALAATRDEAMKTVQAIKPTGMVMLHRVSSAEDEKRVSFSSPRA